MDRTKRHELRYGSTGAFLGKQKSRSSNTITTNVTFSGTDSTTIEFNTSKPTKKKSKN